MVAGDAGETVLKRGLVIYRRRLPRCAPRRAKNERPLFSSGFVLFWVSVFLGINRTTKNNYSSVAMLAQVVGGRVSLQSVLPRCRPVF